MKIIADALPAITAICSRQEIKENTEYRRTKLCVEADCPEGKLLFHTLTGSLVLLESGDDDENCRDGLTALRFLVPADSDELAYADKVVEIVRALDAGTDKISTPTYTVLTTTDCNARCYYCYEAGIRPCYMSEKTAKDVCDHIISAASGREVGLRWFGGEPLINPKVIDVICEGLSAAGVKYSSSMVSNGYRLDGTAIKKAAGLWRLKNVQITLDGCGEVYNRVKAYKEPGDAYSRVIKNIGDALDAGINVHIHLNVSKNNVNDLTVLADELERLFGGREGLTANAALLGDFRTDGKRFDGDGYDADGYLALRRKLKSAGFEGKHGRLQREPGLKSCMADNDACEIILPDGRLCKCDERLDKDCYGSIYSPERDRDDLRSWKEQVKLPECSDCPLYTRCVNLKKCAWVGNNCSKTSQKIRISILKDQITDAYNEWKENLK